MRYNYISPTEIINQLYKWIKDIELYSIVNSIASHLHGASIRCVNICFVMEMLCARSSLVDDLKYFGIQVPSSPLNFKIYHNFRIVDGEKRIL